MDDGGGGQGGRGARQPADRRMTHRQGRESPPVLRTADDPPPPAREQLPLPRRRQQAHLEPQLRNPGGAGTGTPFAAFAGESGNADDAPADATPTSGETDLAAAFLAATWRRRRYRFGD
jgi:hypothetical protein